MIFEVSQQADFVFEVFHDFCWNQFAPAFCDKKVITFDNFDCFSHECDQSFASKIWKRTYSWRQNQEFKIIRSVIYPLYLTVKKYVLASLVIFENKWKWTTYG